MSRLAAVSLVVLTVLIGTAAAAAPDRRPPRIVAGVMLDRDRDQRSDGVRLTYSEPVRHRVDRDGRYPFSLRGYRIQSVAAARGRTLLLTLVEKSRVDAGTRPLVRYRRTKAKPVLDRVGKQAVAQRFRGVRPIRRLPVVLPPPAAPPPPPNSAAPPDLDPDRDGYTAPLDCKPNDPATHPGADDLPDLGFADTNCDGVDGDEAKAVFASPGGNDANPGTKDKPKRQIQAAVSAAAMTRRYVLAATGGYGGVVVAPGVGVYGGYDPKSWRRPSEGGTEITGSPEGVLAVGAKDVTLQLLTIRAVHNGTSVYGLRAIDSSSLRLERVTVTTGSGAPGAAGPNGAPGRAGGDGLPGAKGACDSDVEAPGGAGGDSIVARVGGKGGDGKYESRGGNGLPGHFGTPGGQGGDLTSGHNVVTIEGDQEGKNGANGTNGVAGAPGRGGTDSAVLAAALWRGLGGIEGIYGTPGNGGGGGGAGGGQTGALVINGTGNGGGGGGGGGEGGRGGGGGLPGGGSFGVYLHNSSLIAEGSSIEAGRGGAGGRGGNGGPGGAGGKGGAGLFYCLDEIGPGGTGGRGGSGGEGGPGGGGAGGPSIGIFEHGTAAAKLTDTTVTHGSGGPGGPGGSPAAEPGIAQDVYAA